MVGSDDAHLLQADDVRIRCEDRLKHAVLARRPVEGLGRRMRVRPAAVGDEPVMQDIVGEQREGACAVRRRQRVASR